MSAPFDRERHPPPAKRLVSLVQATLTSVQVHNALRGKFGYQREYTLDVLALGGTPVIGAHGKACQLKIRLTVMDWATEGSVMRGNRDPQQVSRATWRFLCFDLGEDGLASKPDVDVWLKEAVGWEGERVLKLWQQEWAGLETQVGDVRTPLLATSTRPPPLL